MSIVSKYIGETEKNIGRVFDAAEAADPVLLFDDAEVLLGKRTDVKDSHDSYAHIELNYLFREIEDFGGLSILSTKGRGDFDKALSRRFRFCNSHYGALFLVIALNARARRSLIRFAVRLPTRRHPQKDCH